MYTESLIFVNIIGSRIRNSVANSCSIHSWPNSSPTLPTEQLFANWFATVCQLIPKKKRDFTGGRNYRDRNATRYIFALLILWYGSIEAFQALLLTVLPSYGFHVYYVEMYENFINQCVWAMWRYFDVLRSLSIEAYVVDYYH